MHAHQATLAALLDGGRCGHRVRSLFDWRGGAAGPEVENIDFEGSALEVTGSLQRLKSGLAVAEQKTVKSRQRVSLAAAALTALRQHKIRQAEERLRVGAA